MPTSTMPTVGYRISELKPYLNNVNNNDLLLVSQQQSDLTSYKSTAIEFDDFATAIARSISSQIIANFDSVHHVITTKTAYNALSAAHRTDPNTLYIISDDCV